ncbi:cytochrome c [Thioclava sp. A2]|uniref:c-type cytochrome n=1 Tax=Thioclava sp. FCG-A2 TaxID=3080562 RepID=UPI002953BBCB|nr:cytochrome c [Thioclava sp. A2]MDV7270247.1 cytochrome c [Thioclava sp. A2]
MKRYLLPLAGVAALAVGAAFFLNQPTETVASEPAKGDPIVAVAQPKAFSAQAQAGKQAFDAVCAACHGESGTGRMGMGPPLIHKIYEPSHHGDMAFERAVKMGVQSHHWPFGNMPPQNGLTGGDVKNITRYVREIQSANGIY